MNMATSKFKIIISRIFPKGSNTYRLHGFYQGHTCYKSYHWL